MNAMLRILCAAILLTYFTAAGSSAAPQRPDRKPAAQRPDAAKPTIEITLDTAAVPEMAEWAARAKKLCEEAYPMIVEQLGAPGFQPPTKVKIVFKNDKGIAYTAGTTITCMAEWFQKHPDDYGAVIHELCHVVQAYGRQKVPGWVTEGIADYVRWFVWEPAERRPRIDPRPRKHTDSYQVTAGFFDWIVRTKDKTFVTRLNAACRDGKYKPELFEDYASAAAEKLWAEYVEAAGKPKKR